MSNHKQLQDVAYSILDLAPIVTGGTAAEALQHSLDLAQHAEHWGYKRFWVAEHHGMPGIASSATSVVIGYLAAGTSTIRVGSGGVMLPNHAPLVIAEQFGTLEALYPGRIDLGLGRAPGTDPVTARALRRGPERYGQDFPELVYELRSCFLPRTEPAKKTIRAVPGEGAEIPIWLLGSSDFSAQMSAELGLPFAFASHFAPNYALYSLNLYREKFQRAPVEGDAFPGRLEAPYAAIGVNVIAADTDEEAQYLATSMLQQQLNLMRGRPGQLKPPVDDFYMLCSDDEREAIAERNRFTVIGSPETIRAGLERLVEETDADELIVSCQMFDHAARLHAYELVADVLRRK